VIVLQDGGKTQPMGLRHTLAGNQAVFEIHAFRQPRVGVNSPINPV